MQRKLLLYQSAVHRGNIKQTCGQDKPKESGTPILSDIQEVQSLICKNASMFQLRRFGVTTASCVVVSALLHGKEDY